MKPKLYVAPKSLENPLKAIVHAPDSFVLNKTNKN